MLHKVPRSAQKYFTKTMSQRSVSNLTHSCDTLKQDLKKASRAKNPILKLHEVRASATYYEVIAMIKEARNTIRSNNKTCIDPEARTAAAAHTICHAFDAIIELSKSYELSIVTRKPLIKGEDKVAAEINDSAFQKQIMPAHEAHLMSQFRSSWKKNNEQRQAAIFSVIHPEVAAEIGLTPHKTQAEISRMWGPISPDKLLLKSELLALIDYVNSTTGTFNAVNGAAIADAYYGQNLMNNLTQVISTALVGSINKLTEHPYFGKTDIKVFKGINLSNDAASLFRYEALKAAVGSGKIIAFPQVLSASSDPLQSYACSKHDQGYNVECEMTMESACYVDPFHDNRTMGEHEVLGKPGQKFIVTGRYSVTTAVAEQGGLSEIDRFVLEPAKKKRL